MQRAALLAEAGRVARVLETLLKRADHDAEVASGLVKDLAKHEETQLHRGYGRIESRARFKKKHSLGAPSSGQKAEQLDLHRRER